MAFKSHGAVAASVRKDREANPSAYCTNSRCLWRVQTRQGRKPCPKHMQAEIVAELAQSDPESGYSAFRALRNVRQGIAP